MVNGFRPSVKFQLKQPVFDFLLSNFQGKYLKYVLLEMAESGYPNDDMSPASALAVMINGVEEVVAMKLHALTKSFSLVLPVSGGASNHIKNVGLIEKWADNSSLPYLYYSYYAYFSFLKIRFNFVDVISNPISFWKGEVKCEEAELEEVIADTGSSAVLPDYVFDVAGVDLNYFSGKTISDGHLVDLGEYFINQNPSTCKSILFSDGNPCFKLKRPD
jgi:hypothetical protein